MITVPESLVEFFSVLGDCPCDVGFAEVEVEVSDSSNMIQFCGHFLALVRPSYLYTAFWVILALYPSACCLFTKHALCRDDKDHVRTRLLIGDYCSD